MNPELLALELYSNAASFCTSATFNLTNGVIVTQHP